MSSDFSTPLCQSLKIFGPVDACSDRARTVDIPTPRAPGGSIQTTSSTLTPAFMREFRDAASRLVNNATNNDGGPKMKEFR